MTTKTRKTFAVADLRDSVNNYLALDASTVETRAAVAGVLESVLFQTGNYQGFQYLASEYLPAEQQTLDNVLREGYDATRRRYF